MTTLLKTDRLLVSRQDPKSRSFVRVGTLEFDGQHYTFTYDDDVRRALPGLPLGRTHSSDPLFPIFAERVKDPHRPEWTETLKHMGQPAEAGPFEVLAVSGGRRTGDTYELTPLPSAGAVDLPFLVHGVRHLTDDDDERRAIDRLKSGERLSLRCEPENPVNDRALLVTQGGDKLGYVSDPLLDYVHAIIAGDHELLVERVNPPEAGMHMRLLVRLRGRYHVGDARS